MKRTKNRPAGKKYYNVAIMDGDTTVIKFKQKANKDVQKILASEGIDSVHDFLMQSICLCWLRLHGDDAIKAGFHVTVDEVKFVDITQEYLDALKRSIVNEFEIRKLGEGVQGATDFKRVKHIQLMDASQLTIFMDLSPKYMLEILELFKLSSRKVIMDNAKKMWDMNKFTEVQRKDHIQFLKDVDDIPTSPENNPTKAELDHYLSQAMVLTLWDFWDVHTFDQLKNSGKEEALVSMGHFKTVLQFEYDILPELYHTRLAELLEYFDTPKLQLVTKEENPDA